MHASFQRLRQRLRPDCQIFPGHEYTEMLLQHAVQREPHNEHARRKLEETAAQARPLALTLTLTLTLP